MPSSHLTPGHPNPRSLGRLYLYGTSPGCHFPPSHHTHITHYIHYIASVYRTYTAYHLHKRSHTCVHTCRKPFTQKQAYETFTFTQGLTHLHTQLHTQAHTARHALLRALAVHKHAPLGAHALAPSGIAGQAGGLEGAIRVRVTDFDPEIQASFLLGADAPSFQQDL